MLTDLRNLPDGARRRLGDSLDRRHRGFDVDLKIGTAEMRVTSRRIEVRKASNGAPTIIGYATVYEAPYDVHGGPPMGWSEVIAKGAADKSVAERDDVYLFFDHDGLPMASVKAGSLRLESDKLGLYTEATPDMRSPFNAEIVNRVESGELDAMSFAFKVTRQRWEDDDGVEADPATAPVRRIQEVKLFDVSVVSFPANPATAVQMSRAGGMSAAEARAELDALRRIA